MSAALQSAMDRIAKREALAARAEKMVEMFRQGVTLEAIGRQFGLTRERVRQIIAGAGVSSAEGGQAQQIRIAGKAVDRKLLQRQRAQEDKHGVPYELLRELRACGATTGYQRQRNNAAKRGIGFALTLAEWWAVWQASGKYHLRGRGIGRYCMSRIRDDGPYALGNVHIQSAVENSREAVEKWRGKDKPIKGVFCLYPGRELAWLAAVGKKRLGFFATAEEAGAARAAHLAESGLSLGRLGRGRGWTFVQRNKSRPYLVRVWGTKNTWHATQDEAEAEYARRCDERRSARKVPEPTGQPGAPVVEQKAA